MFPIKSSPFYTSSFEQKESVNLKEKSITSSEKTYSFDPSVLKSYDYTVYQSELWKLNIMDNLIVKSEFFKKFRWKKEELYSKKELFQFLLFLNLNNADIKYPFMRNDLVTGRACTLLGLHECECQSREVGSSNFHTGKIAEENVREIKECFFFKSTHFEKFNKDIPLIFTGIGVGGGLQEWIILAHFILMGFKKFHINLCDPTANEQLVRLKEFFYHYPDIICHARCYATMENFAEMGIVSDVIVAMDWDKKEKTLAENEKPLLLLSERGTSYFSKHEPDWKIERVKMENNLHWISSH
jgi:hypothetical protein